MNFDKKINIAVGSSRKSKTWINQIIYWSDFINKIVSPVRAQEVFEVYRTLPKSKQEELKDIGGFVGGALKDGIRKNQNVIDRHLITLDADNIQSGQTQNIINMVSSLNCAYAIYSTRKHESARPRLRIIIPLDKPCTAEEYEPIARKIAGLIDINIFDITTFEASRLMYWPSTSSDGEYVFTYEDKPFASASGILGMYKDWHNCLEWAKTDNELAIKIKTNQKQKNPLEKQGIVGSFCKVYNIQSAIAEFLSDIYTPCDIENRYTYIKGSTIAGAIVYETGAFLFSHHATDPCCGKLCNAFDLVRIHLFSDEDNDAKPDTPVVQLPSYKKMCELAMQKEEVKKIVVNERIEQNLKAFETPIKPEINIDDSSWVNQLKYNNQTGVLQRTINNILIILRNDPELKGRLVFEEFSRRYIIVKQLPWNKEKEFKEREWSDDDDAGLRLYLEQIYNLTSKDKINDALRLCAKENSINRVKDYLFSLSWDGTKRIDNLLIDYFGAEDSEYVKTVTKKTLVAAVARVMEPGVKFDTMLILVGKQGVGKSTFLRKLGLNWYSDSLKNFESKDAVEMLQGYWINEIGELEAMARAEVNAVKQFLSKCEDIYRIPFDKHTSKFARQCVFIGTTNSHTFLKDITGGRRFWPIDLGMTSSTKKVFKDLDNEIDQIWAEAVMYWRAGETLYLTEEMEKEAQKQQEAHRETSPKEGMIYEFVNRKIPIDWYKKTIWERREYWNNQFSKSENIELVEREKICAAEIWCECFNGDIKTMKRTDTIEINGILANMEGWIKSDKLRFGDTYGKQRCFTRIINTVC